MATSMVPSGRSNQSTDGERFSPSHVYFPAIDMRAWRLVEREMNHDPEQKLDYAFTVYERTNLD